MSKDKAPPKTGNKMPTKPNSKGGTTDGPRMSPEGAYLPATYEIRPGLIREDN